MLHIHRIVRILKSETSQKNFLLKKRGKELNIQLLEKSAAYAITDIIKAKYKLGMVMIPQKKNGKKGGQKKEDDCFY